MNETTFDWIDEEPRAADRAPRARLLIVLATVPWLVVVALIVSDRPTGPPTTDDGAHVADAVVAPGATSDVAPVGSAGTVTDGGHPDARPTDARPAEVVPWQDDLPAALELTELRGGWRVEAGPEEAAALAVVVARAWLTGLDPQLAIEGVPPPVGERYAEHLVVEWVEEPSREASVVTLLAVVLEGGDASGAQVRRLAVPIAWERDGPRPAGSPWWLPGPDLGLLHPHRTALARPEDHLAAVEALQAAGFVDVELHGLWATSGWPVIAELSGRTRDGHQVESDVWLRPHLDGFAVAGTPLAPTTPPADQHAGSEVGS